MNLEKFVGKSVNITTTSGKEYKNFYVAIFWDYTDNVETNEDSIGLKENEISDGGIVLYQSEIKSIEIVE